MLKNYIYNFYPEGIRDGFSEQYLKSKEFNSLRFHIERGKSWNLTSIKRELKNIGNELYSEGNYELVDLTNFNFNDRAFNFQFKFVKGQLIEFICINISIIAPYYCIYYLSRNISNVKLGKKVDNNFLSYDFNYLPHKYNDLVEASKVLLKKNELKQIKNNSLLDIIPKITFENLNYNRMNMFNCFFLNEPYCIP